MATISLCMIVKNEEKRLAVCLESVRAAADEIIIVDTGSSDKTKEIAARFTDKVFDFQWEDDFSAARNYSFSKASGDFLLWLDADDYLLPADLDGLLQLKSELLSDDSGDCFGARSPVGDSGSNANDSSDNNSSISLKGSKDLDGSKDSKSQKDSKTKSQDLLGGLKRPPQADVYMLRYNTGFDKNGRVTFSFFRERLVRRTAGFVWVEPVHEYIKTHGRTEYREIAVTHTVKTKQQAEKKSQEGRNIRIYEGVLGRGGELSPRGQYYYARELREAGRFEEAARYFRLFLAGKKGWVEDNIAACGLLSECLLYLNERREALLAMLSSFEFDTPRPELCCKIAYYFKLENRFAQAAHWFSAALIAAEQMESRGGQRHGFQQKDYYGYIPNIELAVCHSRLGNLAAAEVHNERAAAFKPDCPAVISNRNYFKTLAANLQKA